MMSLGDLCALVAGRVPLVIELKSHFDGNRKLAARMAEVLASYRRPRVSGMSFDPDQAMALRNDAAIAARGYRRAGLWSQPTGRRRHAGPAPGHARSAPRLPHPAAFHRLLRRRPAGGCALSPVTFSVCSLLAWTVRTWEQRATRRTLCQPDDFRGFCAGNLMNFRALEVTGGNATSLQEIALKGSPWAMADRNPVTGFKTSMDLSEITLKPSRPSARLRLRTGTPVPIRRRSGTLDGLDTLAAARSPKDSAPKSGIGYNPFVSP